MTVARYLHGVRLGINLPLRIEILYNEYNIVAAFSVAILLLLMSLVVLLLRQWSEGSLAKQVEKHQQELAQNEH